MLKEKILLVLLLGSLAFVLLFRPRSSELESHTMLTSSQTDPIRSVRVIASKNIDLQQAKLSLLSFPGVTRVDITPDNTTVRLHFDVERTNLEKLQDALVEAGFNRWLY